MVSIQPSALWEVLIQFSDAFPSGPLREPLLTQWALGSKASSDHVLLALLVSYYGYLESSQARKLIAWGCGCASWDRQLLYYKSSNTRQLQLKPHQYQWKFPSPPAAFKTFAFKSASQKWQTQKGIRVVSPPSPLLPNPATQSTPPSPGLGGTSPLSWTERTWCERAPKLNHLSSSRQF